MKPNWRQPVRHSTTPNALHALNAPVYPNFGPTANKLRSAAPINIASIRKVLRQCQSSRFPINSRSDS